MAALASAADIPPGGEGAIKATFNTRGRSGTVTKTITVETSDPDNRRVRLRLKANVLVEAGFDPRGVNLGRIDLGQEVSKTASFVSRNPAKVKLTGVEVVSENEGLTAKLVKTDGQQGVLVTFKGTEVGTIRGRIRGQTTSEKSPTIDLIVRGIVLGNWALRPRTISFSQPEEGEDPPRRRLKIQSRGEHNFRVLKAVDQAGAVTTKLSKTDAGYELELTLNKVPEKRRGIITITTNDPSERTLKARFFVRRRRPRRLPRRLNKAIKRTAPNSH